MIEYEVRREGSPHRVVISTYDDGPASAADWVWLAAEVAVALSRAWDCELTLFRLDDMAWHAEDYETKVAVYDKGERVTS